MVLGIRLFLNARVELYCPEGIVIMDLNDSFGAIVKLEGEGSINDQASVKTPGLDFNAVGIATRALFFST